MGVEGVHIFQRKPACPALGLAGEQDSLVPYNGKSRLWANNYVPIIGRLFYTFAPADQIPRPLSSCHFVPTLI